MRTLRTLALITVVLASACTSESDRVYSEAKKSAAEFSNDDRRRILARTTPDVSATMSLASITNARIYLDSTRSMMGFAHQPDTRFTRLLESLSYSLPGSHLYKYGIPKSQAKAPTPAEFAREITFSQELRKRDFYNLDYNEDDSLFEYLAQQDEPSLSVLITDGVYSARQTELQSSVVKALEKWLMKGRFFGVLAFRSSFEGDLYSENSRGWVRNVKETSRPFYLFVFSPGEKQFRELREQLSTEFGDLESVAFPADAVDCELTPRNKSDLQSKDVPPQSPYYLHMYNEGVFGNSDTAELTYGFQCQLAKDFPFTDVAVVAELETYTWVGASFKKAGERRELTDAYGVPNSTEGSPAASVSPVASPTVSPVAEKKLEPFLRVKVKKDPSAPYTFYRLIFTINSKPLRPSIRALSTEDDSDRGNAGKTYRFFEFISALSVVHLHNTSAVKLPPSAFFVVKNK